MISSTKIASALALSVLISIPFMGTASAASYCRDKGSDFFDKLADNVCGQIDVKPLSIQEAANSALGYILPENCDMGFSMPGLPAFGGNITGLDSCKILQAITGDMVDAANSEMRDGLDGALDAIKGDTTIPSNVDLNDVVADQVKTKTGS